MGIEKTRCSASPGHFSSPCPAATLGERGEANQAKKEAFVRYDCFLKAI